MRDKRRKKGTSSARASNEYQPFLEAEKYLELINIIQNLLVHSEVQNTFTDISPTAFDNSPGLIPAIEQNLLLSLHNAERNGYF